MIASGTTINLNQQPPDMLKVNPLPKLEARVINIGWKHGQPDNALISPKANLEDPQIRIPKDVIIFLRRRYGEEVYIHMPRENSTVGVKIKTGEGEESHGEFELIASMKLIELNDGEEKNHWEIEEAEEARLLWEKQYKLLQTKTKEGGIIPALELSNR